MRTVQALGLSLAALVVAVTDAGDASACGGCFVQQSESTQVSGHRMILSVSPDHTTLWDQIEYAGNPSSFAWVLPVKGIVDVGLSSDALFQTLEAYTTVTISSPSVSCPQPSCGFASTGTGGGDEFGSGGGGGGGVEVVAHSVVGPYETVQLASTDPGALTTWLTDHGYNIPSDVVPIIDSYVNDGFNFLALKLVPGEGIESMKPVRVTTPGASPVLPLKMVAAGTGAVTPISLWIFAEGRYEPTNFPSFTIDPSQIVWNWDTQSSNYSELRQAGFDALQGFGWLTESAQQMSEYTFDALIDTAQYDPIGSGYGDDAGEGATEAAQADVNTLIGSISSLYVTRLHAELRRNALGQDLLVGASSDQSMVPTYIEVTQTEGTVPACPPPPTCDPTGDPNVDAPPWSGIFDADSSDAHDSGSCALDTRGSSSLPTALGALAALAALSLVRRRR
jgi:hypothetical protein